MAPWGYGKEDGPATWDKEFPIANTGERQSPIDLKAGEVKQDSNLNPMVASYAPFSDAKVLNNGHSVVFQPDAGQAGREPELRGGPLKTKYRFEQFHFHWGDEDFKGSEHRVDGKMYAAELHFVHWNSGKYETFPKAVGSGDPNALCVLGFFLKVGKENAGLKPVTDLFPEVIAADSSVPFPGPYDMGAVLPKALTDYYTYDGSLTTPPLAECVKWIVFKDPLELSAAQMASFRALHNKGGKPIAETGNYRPPCPLKHRKVTTSFK